MKNQIIIQNILNQQNIKKLIILKLVHQETKWPKEKNTVH